MFNLNEFGFTFAETFKQKTLNIIHPIDKTIEEIIYPSLESNASLLKKHTIISWLEALVNDLKKSILFAKSCMSLLIKIYIVFYKAHSLVSFV